MKKLLISFCAILAACQGYAQVSRPDSISKIFTLGEVTVNGTINNSAIQTVNSYQLKQFNRSDLASALQLLPGISLTNVGGRNEAMIYLRGFDLREVPIYADGIPIYVPYDGYVDLSRFTTFDLSQISVSKGFTSILYGANTLGGAINLVSRKPSKPFEAEVQTGIHLSTPGFAGHQSSLNVGTKQGKFYVQGGLSYLEKGYNPLSDKFVTNKYENGGRQDNSDTKDFKASVKAGYTPNATDEYAVSYVLQRSEKGVPIYTGSNPSQTIRYWRYPEWNKNSLYFLSKTLITNDFYVKSNLFLDKYYNKLKAYDNGTYTTQAKSSSFTSIYDDYSSGGAIEAVNEMMTSDVLKVAVHDKYDNHKEYNVGQKTRTFADNTFSAGIEDTYHLNEKINLIVGLSFNSRNSIKAENYFSSKDSIANFPSNKSTALNYQAAVMYKLFEGHSIGASVSRKSRFATLKDRYSYKMGKAIPNPDLKAEHSWNFELNYSGSFANEVQVQAALFQNNLQDAIQQIDNVQPGIYQMQNTGKAMFRGFEGELGWQPLKELKLGTNYTYIERKNQTHPSIKFTDVPNHKAFGYIQYLFPYGKGKSYVQFSGEYDSWRYSTSDGAYKAPEYFLLNAKACANVWKDISFEVSVNNLLDKNYYYTDGYPEEGRNCFISIIYSL